MTTVIVRMDSPFAELQVVGQLKKNASLSAFLNTSHIEPKELNYCTICALAEKRKMVISVKYYILRSLGNIFIFLTKHYVLSVFYLR